MCTVWHVHFMKCFINRSKAFAQRELAPTRFTKIVDLELIDGFAEDPVWIEEMLKIKRTLSGP